MLYTLIEHALSTNDSARHIRIHIKIHLWSHLWHNLSLRGSVGSFDRARSGCEHSASFKSDNMQTNMAAQYDRTIVI